MLNGRPRAIETVGRRDGIIELDFDGVTNGEIRLGEAVCSVTEGKARILSGKLPDGKILPVLTCSEGSFRPDGFIKNGNKIDLIPPDESEIRSLLFECDALKKRTEGLEEQVKRLAAKISSATIF